jgi:hypothetical protein
VYEIIFGHDSPDSFSGNRQTISPPLRLTVQPGTGTMSGAGIVALRTLADAKQRHHSVEINVLSVIFCTGRDFVSTSRCI